MTEPITLPNGRRVLVLRETPEELTVRVVKRNGQLGPARTLSRERWNWLRNAQQGELPFEEALSRVAQGEDPAIVFQEQVNVANARGRGVELRVINLTNGSTDFFAGGRVLDVEEVVVGGRRALRWTVSDSWYGRKMAGV